jgi:hypothetical protein
MASPRLAPPPPSSTETSAVATAFERSMTSPFKHAMKIISFEASLNLERPSLDKIADYKN